MKLEEAGKLVLSPTRTYAPVVKKIFDTVSRENIHGMVRNKIPAPNTYFSLRNNQAPSVSDQNGNGWKIKKYSLGNKPI